MGLVVVPALFITALIFFTLLGVALIYPKSWWGKLLAVCIVVSPLVWLTWDIPVGYVRYKRACDAEAGFKVYADKLAPAKRIRLVDSAYFPGLILNSYETINQVEASDKEFGFVRPRVYALYERDAVGKIKSSLMDKVMQTRSGGKVIESAPSEADYFIEKIDSEFPYRLSKTSYRLLDRNKQLLAEVNTFGYSTANPDKAVMYQGFGCGSSKLVVDSEIKSLLSLIAVEKKIVP